MNAIESYFNGDLPLENKEAFYHSLLQDGKELLNVISTIGLMKKAADLTLPEPPPELDPPETDGGSMADELLELTLKALTEADLRQNPDAAAEEAVELQPPVAQQDLPGTLVQLIARLDAGSEILPPPEESSPVPSGNF